VIEAERQVRAVEELSLKAFCREKGIQPKQLRFWKKDLVKLKNALETTRKKKSRIGLAPGRPSRLEKIGYKLLPWVHHMITQGYHLSTRVVATRAKKYDRSLRRMGRNSLLQMVRRYCDWHDIVVRRVTRVAQEDPSTKVDTATAFLTSTLPLIHQPNRLKKYIINMDQTPYNPSDVDETTMAKRGAKTVTCKKMKCGVGRITICVAVVADGTKLPPLLVFKAKPGGSVSRELSQFPKDCKYIVQENAWTDERVMLYWIDNVLKPYVAECPCGIVPYLFLDKYKCHYQQSCVNEIENLGVEWDILPGGCTGLIQPIDVGVGKPLKACLRTKNECYMLKQCESGKRVTPKNARMMLAKWVSCIWGDFEWQICYNAWRHRPFSYFPEDDPLDYTLPDVDGYDSALDQDSDIDEVYEDSDEEGEEKGNENEEDDKDRKIPAWKIPMMMMMMMMTMPLLMLLVFGKFLLFI
jgi:hypothetical protein